MSAAAPTFSGTGGSQPLAGLPTLLRFALRRDRVRLPVWILGLTAAIAATAASYPGIYATAEERHGALLAISNPGTTALIGAIYGEGDYTYGIMVGHQLLAMTAVVAALMSIFTVVRHTRAEEERGRGERVRSSGVGRHSRAATALLGGRAGAARGPRALQRRWPARGPAPRHARRARSKPCPWAGARARPRRARDRDGHLGRFLPLRRVDRRGRSRLRRHRRDHCAAHRERPLGLIPCRPDTRGRVRVAGDR